MTFLLVTNRRDLTCDFIVRELRRRGRSFVRLNTETIGTSRVTIDPSSRSVRLSLPGRTLLLEDISAAYFRRPEEPLAPSDDISPSDWQYAAGEWSALLKSLYLFIGHRWFSHPANIMLAEDKPRQLFAAIDGGFKVPQGVVTNEIEDIVPLTNIDPLIGKPLKASLVSEEGSGQIVFTTPLPPLDERDKAAFSICPAIYQVEIKKDVDVRVTVVGKSVFATAIHSQVSDASRVDWRQGSNPDLHHEAIMLPSDIEEMCIRLVSDLDLGFGAIDLIRDQDGVYWFLECNPNGQWAWIENRTGQPIAAAIVDQMERIANI